MNKRVDQAADRLIAAFMADNLRHRCARNCAVATIGKGYMRTDCLEETGYTTAELKEIETAFEACGQMGWGHHKTQVTGTNHWVNTKEVASFEALVEAFKAIEKLNPEYFEMNPSKSFYAKVNSHDNKLIVGSDLVSIV